MSLNPRQVMGPAKNAERTDVVFSGKPQDYPQWREEIEMLLTIKDLDTTLEPEEGRINAEGVQEQPSNIRNQVVHAVPNKDPAAAIAWLDEMFTPKSHNRTLGLARDLQLEKLECPEPEVKQIQIALRGLTREYDPLRGAWTGMNEKSFNNLW